MQDSPIEFRGTYRYATTVELERTLAAVRERIEDEELVDLDTEWMRSFVRSGPLLTFDIVLPIAADRYLAAAVFDTLASTAIEGVVEASSGGRCLDWFPAERRGVTL
jgi:hypothetical protein